MAVAIVAVALLAVPAGARNKQEETPETAWPEITAAERSLTSVPQDPEADAIVFINDRHGRIQRKADDDVNVLKYHWRLKVLTERGERYGEVQIPAGKYSRVSDIEARTIRPDGTIVPVDPSQIFEKMVYKIRGDKYTAHVFNFPAVEPGAILEYRYQRHSNNIFFLEPWFFEGEEFTMRSKVTQEIPSGMSYTILCDLCPDVKPEITKLRDGKWKGQSYTLELRDLPGYREEIMMPPPREASPRLEMVLNFWKGRWSQAIARTDRFFIDWASVARYMSYYYDRAIKDGQAEFRSIVAGWVGGINDPGEKVKAIVRHVRDDFRYDHSTWVSGFGVRSVQRLLADKTADNEEKAVLLLAALKAIEVEAYPALVTGKDYGSLNPKFFSLSQFTHVVVALPKSDGTIEWLDPTASYAPYGFTPWRDSGAGALLIRGNEGQVVDLPVKSEPSNTKYEVTVKPHLDGRAELELVAEYTGEDAVDMREELAPASESGRTDYLKDWVGRHTPDGALKSHSIENLTEPDQPLKIAMTIESPGLVTLADGAMLVRGCIFSGYEANPISRSLRSHPFYVDRGWNTEETVVIQPPDGMSASEMPRPARAKSSVASLSFSCFSESNGSVRCSRRFFARRNRWPAGETGAVRGMFDKIVESDRTMVAFEEAKASGG